MMVYSLCRNIYFWLFVEFSVRQKHQCIESIRFMHPRIRRTSAHFGPVKSTFLCTHECRRCQSTRTS